MSHSMRNILGLAAGGLILVAASAQPAGAAPPRAPRPAQPSPRPTVPARPAPAAQYGAPVRPGVPSVQVRPKPLPLTRPTIYPKGNRTRPIGWDWWRTYPWSPYNAWQNPYWYPPYNKNYPYPPDQAYPYYPVPRPYPVPQPTPIPSPWGIGSGVR